MIDKLITTEGGSESTECIAFGNADGKRWIMPCRRMRMAMNLYQPSSPKGRLVKKLFPIRLFQGLISKRIGGKKYRLKINGDLLSIFHNIWGAEPMDFSLFGGTPGKHRKSILQLSRGNDILGYCKVTENPVVAALFDGETNTLRSLHAKGVNCVPKALYRGRTKSGLELFVQSTVKTRHSKVCHEWTAMHDQFLDTLARQTRTELPFEETDYYQSIRDFIDNIKLYPIADKRSFIREEAEKMLAKYTGKHVPCSAYHGDFTPWNTFAEGDTLYVFDWEYGKLTYPAGLDKCHFIIQTAVFEKHLNADQIQELMSEIPADTLKMYLLDVISRFSIREEGSPTEDVSNSLQIWTRLLALSDGV